MRADVSGARESRSARSLRSAGGGPQDEPGDVLGVGGEDGVRGAVDGEHIALGASGHEVLGRGRDVPVGPATTKLLGTVCQACSPSAASCNAARVIGRWTAAMTRAASSGRSAANCSW